MTPTGVSPAVRATSRDWLLWAVAVTLVIVVLTMFVIGTQGDKAWGYDLGAYTAAAARIAASEPLYQGITQAGPFRPGPGGLYLYAPHLAILVVPFSGLDGAAQMAIWAVAHVAALVAACWLMPVRRSIRALVLLVGGLSFPMLSDLVLGNVSTFVLLGTVLTWRWLGRPAGSLALAATMTLRPTMGLVLLVWLVRREWLSVAWVLAAGAVLVIATLPLMGLDSWTGYLTMLRNLQVDVTIHVNGSLGAVAWRNGIGLAWAELLQLAGYAIALLAVVVGIRRDAEVAFATSVAASTMLAPLLWGHYTLSLLVPVALLAARGHRWALVLPLVTWIPTLLSDADLAYPIVSLSVAVLVPLLTMERPSTSRRAGRSGQGLGGGEVVG